MRKIGTLIFPGFELLDVFGPMEMPGLFVKASVLDNQRATTNTAAFSWVCEQGPGVEWAPQELWVKDGPFLASSGVSVGMGMALGAIALMDGEDLTEKGSDWCEYAWHKGKTHDPFARIHGMV